ncbi:NagC family transcriptional regulator [Halocalculus aciditolerans]|uniref:Nascent polypeptide-associated complex protein n=2 Tax=Halocalculus aciditolerans TaxID=1383812 RepID=A0A830FCZ7_9EURY|nr:NagC family transcriptional regulator [Halocalculus aciditolerans]
MNPRKMEQMMKQMGIDVDEIDATEVIIRKADGSELYFDDADVTRMDARGQQTYQVIGDPTERDATEGGAAAEVEAGEPEIPEEDVELVASRTGSTKDAAREALEETDGDLAAAIDTLE